MGKYYADQISTHKAQSLEMCLFLELYKGKLTLPFQKLLLYKF